MLEPTGNLVHYEMKLGRMAHLDSLGVTLGTARAGLVVIDVDPDSPARRAMGKFGGVHSLNPGNLIVKVNGAEIDSLESVQKAANDSGFEIEVRGTADAISTLELKFPSAEEKVDAVPFTGRIIFNDFEGGFFGIVTDEGERFDPTNLPDQFEKKGLRVSGRLRPRPDLVGFHMWGTFADVLEIKSK